MGKFETGNVAIVQSLNNIGRVGVFQQRERHPGSFDIVHLKDAAGHRFAMCLENVCVIGKGTNAWISLPKDDGIKMKDAIGHTLTTRFEDVCVIGKGAKVLISLPTDNGIKKSIAED